MDALRQIHHIVETLKDQNDAAQTELERLKQLITNQEDIIKSCQEKEAKAVEENQNLVSRIIDQETEIDSISTLNREYEITLDLNENSFKYYRSLIKSFDDMLSPRLRFKIGLAYFLNVTNPLSDWLRLIQVEYRTSRYHIFWSALVSDLEDSTMRKFAMLKQLKERANHV